MLDLLEDVDRAHYSYQITPGANHIQWILLHFIGMDARGVTLLGADSHEFDAYTALSDQPPHAEPYPTPDLLAMVQRSHTLLLEQVRRLSDPRLEQPPAASLLALFPTIEAVLLGHLWHDGFHAGQIAMIRRGLGLAPRAGALPNEVDVSGITRWC